jgi:hypothetical protein
MNPADQRYGADSSDSPLRDLDSYRPREIDLTHQPARPTWDCSACGQEWPCDRAREELVQQTGGGTPLAIAAWGYLDDWVRDRGEGPFLEAFERFLHWTRSSTFG